MTMNQYPIRGFDPSISEGAVLESAIAQLARTCERDGLIFDQPSRRESQVLRDRVILRNGARELARYRGESNADGKFRLVRLVPRS